MLLSTLEVLTTDDLNLLNSATDLELEEFLIGLSMPDREAILDELIKLNSPPEATATEAISLHEFGKLAWSTLRPGEEFIDGEHIRVLCAHLEHATNTPNYELAIMEPPACGKSIWTAVIWPAWTWGPRNWAAARFLFTSYSKERGKDDAERCKNLIESEWYQAQWPVELTSDAVMSFGNTAGGQRKTAGTGGLGTGEHPHFVVADDANKQTDSPDEFANAVSWWTGQMSTRGIIASIGSRRICIGQRLRMNDVPGACIDLGYDILCLPMWAWESPTKQEIERGDWRPKPTTLPELLAEKYDLKRPVSSDGTVPPWKGWEDWRKPGELLWPDGITEETARSRERTLGPIDAAAQFQQRPIKIAANGMFPRTAVADRMLDWANIPWGEIDKVGRYWDKAQGSTEGADYTAGVCIARWIKKSPVAGMAPEIRLIVLDVVIGKWNPFDRNVVIRQTSESDEKLYGAKFELWIEADSRNAESRQISHNELVGLGVRFDYPVVSKVLRARHFSAAWHGGKVWIVRGPWNQIYLGQLEIFDGEDSTEEKKDDCVDGSSGMANKLLNTSTTRAAPPTGARSKV